jgi:hypothetical protein
MVSVWTLRFLLVVDDSGRGSGSSGQGGAGAISSVASCSVAVCLLRMRHLEYSLSMGQFLTLLANAGRSQSASAPSGLRTSST